MYDVFRFFLLNLSVGGSSGGFSSIMSGGFSSSGGLLLLFLSSSGLLILLFDFNKVNNIYVSFLDFFKF